MLTVRLPPWRTYAACHGRGELFYAADPLSETIALAVCRGCGVREACLAAALVEESDAATVYGVRGGLTANERRQASAASAVQNSVQRSMANSTTSS
jgi:hypothetical protein